MSGSVVKYGYAPGEKPVRCSECNALRLPDFGYRHLRRCSQNVRAGSAPSQGVDRVGPTTPPPALTYTEQDNIDKALRGPWIGPDFCNVHASLTPCPTCNASWYQAWEAEEA